METCVDGIWGSICMDFDKLGAIKLPQGAKVSDDAFQAVPTT